MDCVASCDYVIAVYGTAALAAVCWVCVFAAVRTRVGTVRWSFELGLGVSASVWSSALTGVVTERF